jgi:hypothetical protein
VPSAGYTIREPEGAPLHPRSGLIRLNSISSSGGRRTRQSFPKSLLISRQFGGDREDAVSMKRTGIVSRPHRGSRSEEAAMNRVKMSAKGLLLIGGIGIAATGLAGVALSAEQPSSVGSGPMTVVIRGSSESASLPSSESGASPVVLRGSPPAAAQPPVAGYTCPDGYDYASGYGCVTSGYADAPYDYDYWPYYGFDGFSSRGQHHGFRHGFVHGAGRAFAPPFGHSLTNGFGHRLAHSGGFGHR